MLGLADQPRPESRDVLRALTDAVVSKAGFKCLDHRSMDVANVPVMIIRVAYTGDLGYEAWLDAEHALPVWDAITAAGAPYGITPAGILALDVARRKLNLLISEDELAKRKKAWQAPKPPLDRGYWKLYNDHVLQADEGADLDFLVGQRGAFVPRDNH